MLIFIQTVLVWFAIATGLALLIGACISVGQQYDNDEEE